MKRSLLVLLAFCCLQQVVAQNYSIQLQSGIFTPAAERQQESPSELVNGSYYRLVQFYELPSDAEKADLAEAGVSLGAYVPNNAYHASVAVGTDLANLAFPKLRSIVRIDPKRKLDAWLSKKEYPEWAMRGEGSIELVISYFEGLDATLVAEWVQTEGAEVQHILADQGALRVIIPTSGITKFSKLPYLYFLEVADDEPQPENLPGRTNHRSNMIATDYASGLHFDGTGVNVALNDDGIIGPHIDYTGRLYGQFIGYNNGDHGDHCAGTIFGAGNRNPVTRGMAFGARLGAYGVGGFFANNYQAFDSIYSHYVKYGVRITSTSYSNGNNAGYTNLARTMDIQINNLPDIMHVFSAGNAGTENHNYGAGAGWGNITGGHKQAKNVMTVGNLTNIDVLASSSSRGPAKDGRIKPDICGVGTSVNSTIDPHDYDVKTGTSMSCPGVAGVLAQLYHGYKTLHNGVNPPSDLIKAAVLNTGDDLGNPGPDFKHGWGRINAKRAWKLIENGQYLQDSVGQGGLKTHNITVPAGVASVRVMVYWHDKEAAAGVLKALVNNLDMTLTTPASQVVLPLVLDKTPTVSALNATAVPGVDTLNNMEQVTIDNPAAGSYTVSVAGTSVPSGPQKYVVVYEFVVDEITVVYPSGGESLVPGTQEFIRWDAVGSTGTFTVQYSTNNGSSWNNISSSVAGNLRHLNWTPPSGVTGKALVRVSRGSLSDISDANFSIIGRPGNLQVDWVCMDSMQVSYTPVTGATGYVVSLLGSTYMDSVAFSTTTSCVIKNINTQTTGWFSVHAVGPDDCKGRRAVAQQHPAVPFNCALPDDIGITQFITPNTVSVFSCAGSFPDDTVRILVKNNGSVPLSNFTAGYSINGGTPVAGTFIGSIASGASLMYTFPQPIAYAGAGQYQIKAWVTHPSDNTPANDTVLWEKNMVQPVPVLLPLVEDFESFTLCDTVENCGNEVCDLTNGWINEKNVIDDHIDWRVHRGPTPTNNEFASTGPVMDFAPGVDTGKYLYLEATNCAVKSAHLLSPCIDLTNIPSQTPVLSFSYHMYGSDMGSLSLDVLANGQWFANVMPSISGNQGNQWKSATVNLSAYAGQVINLRFRGTTGGGEASDISLDHIEVSTTSSLETQELIAGLQVHPNPSEGVFNLSWYDATKVVSIVVTDVSGKVIWRGTPVEGATTSGVDISHTAPGIYLLSVHTEAGVFNRKLFKR